MYIICSPIFPRFSGDFPSFPHDFPLSSHDFDIFQAFLFPETTTLGEQRGALGQGCAGVQGCAHFAWWSNGGCHLQDSPELSDELGGDIFWGGRGVTMIVNYNEL